MSIFDNARGGNDKLYGGDDGDIISGDLAFMDNFAIGGNDNLYGDDGKDELVGDAFYMLETQGVETIAWKAAIKMTIYMAMRSIWA